jgi:hypothetical protein
MYLKFLVLAVLFACLSIFTPSKAVAYQDGDDLLLSKIHDGEELLLCQGVEDFLTNQGGERLIIAYQDGDDLLLAYQDGDDLLLAYQDGDDLLSYQDGDDLLAILIILCQDTEVGH